VTKKEKMSVADKFSEDEQPAIVISSMKGETWEDRGGRETGGGSRDFVEKAPGKGRVKKELDDP